MKEKKHADEQIGFACRQAESGISVGEVCRKVGIAESTFFHGRQKYAGQRELKEEKRKLKQLVADLSLDKATL